MSESVPHDNSDQSSESNVILIVRPKPFFAEFSLWTGLTFVLICRIQAANLVVIQQWAKRTSKEGHRQLFDIRLTSSQVQAKQHRSLTASWITGLCMAVDSITLSPLNIGVLVRLRSFSSSNVPLGARMTRRRTSSLTLGQ